MAGPRRSAEREAGALAVHARVVVVRLERDGPRRIGPGGVALATGGHEQEPGLRLRGVALAVQRRPGDQPREVQGDRGGLIAGAGDAPAPFGLAGDGETGRDPDPLRAPEPGPVAVHGPGDRPGAGHRRVQRHRDAGAPLGLGARVAGPAAPDVVEQRGRRRGVGRRRRPPPRPRGPPRPRAGPAPRGPTPSRRRRGSRGWRPRRGGRCRPAAIPRRRPRARCAAGGSIPAGSSCPAVTTSGGRPSRTRTLPYMRAPTVVVCSVACAWVSPSARRATWVRSR